MRAFSLAVMVASFTVSACNNVPPRPAPPPGSFLVLLCKASDVATEPQPVSFYQAAFSKTETDGLAQYFDTISAGKLDISGSEVFGWFTMPVTAATILARNNTTNPNRSQTATDCRNAALPAIVNSGQIVDPANYAGVISVVNVPADVGAAGARNMVVSAHFEVELGFVAHEMLHLLGLPDSWRMAPDLTADHVWKQAPDTMYGDCWDMMSFRSCVATFNTAARGPHGPELQGAFRKRLGWLDTARIYHHAAFLAGPKTVTLAPLSQPHQSGYLLAEVDVPNQGHYSVEYRVASSRFDRGIPTNAVVIREQRNGTSFLVRKQNNTFQWTLGEVFTDVANYTRISIDDIQNTKAVITIRTDFSPTAPAVGSICGDKYRGAVLPCPSGSTCRTRRTGQIQSIDFFCQIP